ncbi:hypothetical protein AZ66_09270 [Paenibacillus sp. E194]|nr:hypothetical protein AZ66_09270 [Paenibacillus sp. E194]
MNNSSIILFIVIFIQLLRQILSRLIIGYEKTEIREEGKKLQWWGLILVAIIYLGVFFLYYHYIYSNIIVLKMFWISFLTISGAFNFFIEWKYSSNRKQCIVTAIIFPLAALLVAIVIYEP